MGALTAWIKVVIGAVASWGKVFEKLTGLIPSKTDRWKNELEKLERERDELENFPATEKNVNRCIDILYRISYLESRLRDHAKD